MGVWACVGCGVCVCVCVCVRAVYVSVVVFVAVSVFVYLCVYVYVCVCVYLCVSVTKTYEEAGFTVCHASAQPSTGTSQASKLRSKNM